MTPTLGTRGSLFGEMLGGLSSQTVPVRHVIIAPAEVDLGPVHGAVVIPDPAEGLSAAVNAGIGHDGGEAFFYWLNDDDLVRPDGLRTLVDLLERPPNAVAAIGGVDLIGVDGLTITTLHGGAVAVGLLPWGPGMMVSPGVLYRLDAVRAAGGLDSHYLHAGDLDLLLRLRAQGPILSTRAVIGAFRWHADSLTVRDARASLAEAEAVRLHHHRRVSRRRETAYRAWRPIARILTRTAKAVVTRRARAT